MNRVCRRLLDEIQALWRVEVTRARDARISLGLKLHEYVEAWMVDAEGMTNRERLAHVPQLTREAAVSEAAKSLGTDSNEVGSLIKVAMLVHLLFQGLDLGRSSYRVLRAMGALVQRDQRVGPEVWVLHPGTTRDRARAFVERILKMTESSSLERLEVFARVETALVVGAKPGATDCLRPPRPLGDGDGREDEVGAHAHYKPRTLEDTRNRDTAMVRCAAKATPSDLADLIADMILRSPDPIKVRRMIYIRLRTAPKRAPITF